MNWHARVKKAFTLVELLVVIGIIALLIAILMPALSRARKQALAASCGSNERQVTYGALAYANDWREMLPTRIGFPGMSWGPATPLYAVTRLPIIGFDTVTVWDYGSYFCSSNNVGVGGWAFMMRDYLKNDFDVHVCPDGFYTSADMMIRWAGSAPCAPTDQTIFWGSDVGKNGYLWLPHRKLSEPSVAPSVGGVPTTDRPPEIARTASDRPQLLLIADFNHLAEAYFAGCDVPSDGYTGQHVIAANHSGSSFRQVQFSHCLPDIFPPDIGRQEDPEEMPLGMNRARIDARVTWLPWQDWNYFRWGYPGTPRQWHSF